jgi:ABC-type multidrug transport system ATPase subunit
VWHSFRHQPISIATTCHLVVNTPFEAFYGLVAQVVDAVGLSGIPFNISPSALSGGQQRRLALALQLVRGPSVLLLDEPLAGLDWHARRWEQQPIADVFSCIRSCNSLLWFL